MKDLFSVEGKVVIVTGGSRGIGEMIAAGFLANSAKVYITSRKADVCDATAERLQAQYGGECISIPADMSNLAGIEAFCGEFRQREEHLDVLWELCKEVPGDITDASLAHVLSGNREVVDERVL